MRRDQNQYFGDGVLLLLAATIVQPRVHDERFMRKSLPLNRPKKTQRSLKNCARIDTAYIANLLRTP
jgi:hypothetical protein